MLTPEQILTMSMFLVDIYRRMQDDLLINIAINFDCLETIDKSAMLEWQMRKLEEMGGVSRRSQRIIAELTRKALPEVEKLFADAGHKTLVMDEMIYQMAFGQGLLSSIPVPVSASPRVGQVIKAAASSARGFLNLVNTKAVQSANEAYMRTVNQVYLETSMGLSDYNASMRKAVKQLANQGITGADYYYTDANGIVHHRRDKLDVAVRRNILSSVGRAAGDVQLARAKDVGWNHVETSSHVGARPSHAIWQGRIFMLEGSSDEYPNFFEVTRYGEIDGICGVNCRHSFFPFLPGFSTQAHFPKDLEEDRKVYEQSQQQRKLEREIREIKRRILTAEAANDPEGKQEAQLKLKAKERELKGFLEANSRGREREREQVVGFDRSEAQKAVQAEKRVAKEEELRYNKAVEETRSLIRSDATPKKINRGNQNKHDPTRKSYIDGRSVFYGNVEDAQALVDRYHGTGDIRTDRMGQWIKKEFVDSDSIVGYIIDPATGKKIDTTRFAIHYGKNGTHIVPRKPK